MATKTYDFLTSSEYEYDETDIQLSGGVVSLITAANDEYLEGFNDATDLTFNASDIEIVGGANAALKLQSNPGQDFNEDFADDTDFVYNASNTEFTGGLVRQIQKAYRPTYYLGRIFANFTSSFDANYSEGSVTATQVGTPVLNAGKLECLGAGNNAVYWQNTSIGTASKFLTVILKYTPNYNGSPAGNRNIVELNNGTNNNDKIILIHGATGAFRVSGYDSTGGAIWVAAPLDAWAPTSGTEYEIMFTLDATIGKIAVFVDGASYGSNTVGVYTRTTTATRMRVGSGTTYSSADGRFDDVILFSNIQKTAPYTPYAYGLNDPKQPTLYAGYGEDINGDWGDGILTGTANGGASVSAGELDLNYGDVRFVTYAPTGNIDHQQKGCIRFKTTPNYSGTPAATVVFFSNNESVLLSNNELTLYHQAGTGNLVLNQRNAAGVSEVGCSAAWNPTSGTEYEIEVNYDLTNAQTRIFVDGILHSSDLVTTGTRSAAIGHFAIGTNWQESTVSNFSINDFIVFADPQHVANYTPSWAGIAPYEYYGDTITLPEMEYTGAGTLVSFDNFLTTETNAPRYTLQIARSGNYLYWDGGAWAISNNTYAQANPKATFLANLAALPINGQIYGQFRIYTQNSIGTQQSIEDLTASLTAQIYAISNPAIDLDLAITPSLPSGVANWLAFTATVSEAGSDAITFSLSDDNGVTYKYWNGAIWSVSSGYAQSNDWATINTNFASFPKTSDGMKVKVYLHSATGVTTPNIGNLLIEYNDVLYAIDNPSISPEETTGMDTFNGISATISQSGSDLVKYVLEINGVKYYWNGVAWAVSSGYAQSSTAAEINANVSSLTLSAGSGVKPVIYLHSATGVTTPSISSLVMTYDYTVIMGTYDFSEREDYTYDGDKVVVDNGNAELDNNVPSHGVFFGAYDTSINENWNGLPGAATGGAIILAGKLDLAHADIRYVTYTFPFGTITSPNYGTVRALFTPNYSGNPATQQYFACSSFAHASNTNSMIFSHKANGNLNVVVYDALGSNQINQDLGVWNPTAGTEYEILFAYDFTDGDTKLFVDGFQFGSTITTTLSRDSNISIIRIGSSVSGAQSSNFFVRKFAVFSKKLWNNNYTPGSNYDYALYKYSIDNPSVIPGITFATDGVTGFTGVINETGSDRVKFTLEIDGVETYWDGANWSTSTGYSQSNGLTDINTNVSSLDIITGVIVRPIVYLHSETGGATPSVSEIIITYSKFNPPDTPPVRTFVSGYLTRADNTVLSGAIISVKPSRSFSVAGKDIFIFESTLTATTDGNGYFEFELIPSELADGDNIYYNFTITVGADIIYHRNITVPNQTSIDFNDLL